MRLLEGLSWLTGRIQTSLFPHIEECCEEALTEKQKRLIMILEIVEVEKHVDGRYNWLGRKPKDRYSIARAFVAKAVYNYPDTKAVIEALRTVGNLWRICGFHKKGDIPSSSTFSRAFQEFAKSSLGDKVHDALVKEYISEEIIGHISRDATAIEGNERSKKKKEAKVKVKKKGRPKKGEECAEKIQTRIEKQVNQNYDEAMAGIPTCCDVGSKINAKGYKETWIGYKLHADTTDCGLPITVLLTSASLHDSQVAIPMMLKTTEKTTYLYDVMDSAYDADGIYTVSRKLGHVPIIDKNPRRGDKIPMAPAEALRYNERTVAERFNGRLKEEFGGRNVKVRGSSKVALHLMFGVIVLFADQLLKLVAQ